MGLRDTFAWINTALFYHLHYNNKRDNNLWVFGCWGGLRYTDNSKYLYEYVLNTNKSITAIWVTKSIDIYKRLKCENKACCLYGSNEANKILSRAGVAFFTNSINDFGDKDYLNGAYKIGLFHGVGLKKELRELNEQNNFIKNYLKKLKDK